MRNRYIRDKVQSGGWAARVLSPGLKREIGRGGRKNGRRAAGSCVGLCFLLTVLLCACAAQPSAESGQRTFNSNPLLEPGDADGRNLAGLLQQTAAGALVRLEAEGTVGSGVIYELNGERMVLVTAGHVLEGKSAVKIIFQDGLEVVCEELARSANADVGFLTVDMDRIPEENAGHYCYAYADKEAADSLAAGDGIIVTGSRDGAAGNAYEGELLDPWIYMEDFAQYMMWGKTYVKAGMSGGGVFDLRGRLIGILCGEDGENGIAALPLSIIRTEYEQLIAVP